MSATSIVPNPSEELERQRRSYSLPELLDLAGFRVRTTTRADCTCPGHSHMTISYRGDVFYCHRCGRKGSCASLMRKLGLLSNDPQSLAQRHQEARERARLQSVARRLRAAEWRVLWRCRANLLCLIALRRNAGARLAALIKDACHLVPEQALAEAIWPLGAPMWHPNCVSHHSTSVKAGASERFPGETELCWDALRFVAGHELRISASYLVAAFANEKDRAIFALHPEERASLVDRVLEEGGLYADRGRWMELVL